MHQTHFDSIPDKPFQTFRQLLSRPKDSVPELQRSGVISKIPCANCPMVYIGQTGRRLCQCLSEHKRAVRRADFNSSAGYSSRVYV